ncbi:uncharacterized protein SOCG_01599 [Schizosaccharomyces octosporus yFS286]|uniref:Uncharacterized protein n=1 Tax=Schizosaccharomyces octosporus (strain yFS286) TaxID=483514 RepID=S9PQ69_SCHOY|nr:uncharacterized protein SOCG_01599 [Schizosaccharomyces octosporus yFS286]EPX71381.1 hypothetical protein SOCG_01599 [Schizosaccharomyces octosporus yFS286]
MADGSVQNSAQESANNTRSDTSEKNKFQCHFWRGIATTQLLLYHSVFLIIVFGYKIPLNTGVFYGLAGGSIGSIIIFVLVTLIAYPGWFTQAGCNMCVAVIYTGLLNVVGFVFYRNVKKIIGFEKMNDIAFYGVCFVNVAVFVLFWMNPTARERFRLLVIYIGNGANAIGNGIRNAVNLAFGTNQGDEAPQNEEIELQPFAGQSAEV